MIRNMGQVNKMLESVNNELKASELTKVMDQFEQVSTAGAQTRHERCILPIHFLGLRRDGREGEGDR